MDAIAAGTFRKTAPCSLAIDFLYKRAMLMANQPNEESMALLNVSDSEFESKVLKGTGYTLVDFWAEWCGPCKQLAPILDQVANDMEGKLTIAKVNIDENTDTPQKYGVRGIPTLILFKDGEAVATKVGALQKSKLVEWIESVI